MSRLKYALIGCGRRGRSHANAVAEMGKTFEVVAVCDADPEAAQRAADRLGARPYTDVRELVAREELDVCDVVVPGELHHAVSCYLSKHGIHHNVETPLAPTLGLMDLMIGTAAQYNVKLQTSENFPTLPVEQFVCQIIRSGAIGPVHRCYRLFSTTGYHGLAAIRQRMGARPVSVSSIGHTMPVVPYVDRARRDWTSEGLSFFAVDFDNGGLAMAMVGNKNNCLGRNRLVGFETCGERGTIVTNGNQGATGGETVNVCTDEDIALRAARASTYAFQREYTDAGTLKRMWVDLPESLGGTVEWVNPYRDTQLSETLVSVATLLDRLARAAIEDVDPAWPGEFGRADMEMVLAAQRSIQANRQPVALPLAPDSEEEAAFDRDFVERFGVHPREDLDAVLGVSFKAR
jgi:predicted dehydrogenase